MSALVEAHTGDEIDSALRAGARIVGINNRDLKLLRWISGRVEAAPVCSGGYRICR
jgi:indole-3-glycerol phosphate synthase